jgi:hypothetical protein
MPGVPLSEPFVSLGVYKALLWGKKYWWLLLGDLRVLGSFWDGAGVGCSDGCFRRVLGGGDWESLRRYLVTRLDRILEFGGRAFGFSGRVVWVLNLGSISAS